jgi:hypothetical protein
MTEKTYHIKVENGFWTVNGCRYQDLSTEEQEFFCEFLEATKLDEKYLFQL